MADEREIMMGLEQFKGEDIPPLAVPPIDEVIEPPSVDVPQPAPQPDLFDIPVVDPIMLTQAQKVMVDTALPPSLPPAQDPRFEPVFEPQFVQGFGKPQEPFYAYRPSPTGVDGIEPVAVQQPESPTVESSRKAESFTTPKQTVVKQSERANDRDALPQIAELFGKVTDLDLRVQDLEDDFPEDLGGGGGGGETLNFSYKTTVSGSGIVVAAGYRKANDGEWQAVQETTFSLDDGIIYMRRRFPVYNEETDTYSDGEWVDMDISPAMPVDDQTIMTIPIAEIINGSVVQLHLGNIHVRDVVNC